MSHDDPYTPTPWQNKHPDVAPRSAELDMYGLIMRADETQVNTLIDLYDAIAHPREPQAEATAEMREAPTNSAAEFFEARLALSGLSVARQEIVRYIGNGFTNEEISRHLKPAISENKVKAHLKPIMHQLGALNRVHVISRIMQLADAPPSTQPEPPDTHYKAEYELWNALGVADLPQFTKDIANHVVRGAENKRIAATLYTSEATVKIEVARAVGYYGTTRVGLLAHILEFDHVLPQRKIEPGTKIT